MSGDAAKAALEETVRKLEAEEGASSTKAERAAEAVGQPQQAAVEAQQQANAQALLAQVMALPAEKLTPMLIVAMDLGVRRLAEWRGGEQAREQYALRPDERELLSQVWTPIVAHYINQLEVHPLVAAVGVTGFVYVGKALPAGGLEAVLGGSSTQPAPRAEVPSAPPHSTAELVNPAPADDVLEMAKREAERLRREKENEARA